MTTITTATFTLAGEGSFVGIHDPSDTWNGFANPMFTLEVAREIAKLVAEQNGDDVEDVLTVHDDGRVTYYYAEDGETETMPTAVINGTTYHAVMNWAWCWEVAPIDSSVVGS
jgi:hypothetical protein